VPPLPPRLDAVGDGVPLDRLESTMLKLQFEPPEAQKLLWGKGSTAFWRRIGAPLQVVELLGGESAVYMVSRKSGPGMVGLGGSGQLSTSWYWVPRSCTST
jgi:hypothetical protein